MLLSGTSLALFFFFFKFLLMLTLVLGVADIPDSNRR